MKRFWIVLGIGLILIGLLFYFENKPKLVDERTLGSVPTETQKRNIVFKLAIMADVHDDGVELNKALAMAKNEGDSLVVVNGDLTINGTQKEEDDIKKVLDDGGIKYVAVPGTHDDYKRVWLWGNKYQSLIEDNWKLILIDNSDWRGLGEEQKKWIANEVQVCLVMHCVVAFHMPLVNNFSRHLMGEYSSATAIEASWLKDLLIKNNVRTAYSGHLHYSSDYSIDGWETVLVGAITRDRNTESPRFTEVTLFGDGSINNEVKVISD